MQIQRKESMIDTETDDYSTLCIRVNVAHFDHFLGLGFFVYTIEKMRAFYSTTIEFLLC